MFTGNGLHHFDGTVIGVAFSGRLVSWNHEQEKLLERYEYTDRNFKLGNAAVIKSSYLPYQSTCKIEYNGKYYHM